MVKVEEIKIPIFKIIDIESCRESYIIIEDKEEKRVITDDQYTYKNINATPSFHNDKFQMKISNDYYTLQQAKFRECNYITQLEAILLGKDHVEFRLPKLQMTYREFLSDNRCHRQIGQILKQIDEAIEKFHKLGYVHRNV